MYPFPLVHRGPLVPLMVPSWDSHLGIPHSLKWKVCLRLGCALIISEFNQRLNTAHPSWYKVSNASNLDIIQLAANRSTNTVPFVRKKAIITRTVPTGRTKSVKIVTEVTLQFPGTAQSSKRN